MKLNEQITTPELRELLTETEAFASRHFERTGSVSPMWIAVLPDGERIVLATPFSCPEEKEILTRAVRKIFQEPGVVRFAFMMEAWVAFCPEGIDRDQLPDNLENYEGRKEALVILAEDVRGGSAQLTRMIERDAEGKGILLPAEAPQYTRSEGRFVGMLTQGRPE